MVEIKKKWFHVADNTVINCPAVDYKFNKDTYSSEKRIFWILSIIGVIGSILVIVLCNNSIMQTIAGSFMGGILSLFVWLFTIRQQDNMNYEIAKIDMHIAIIEEHLERIHDKVKFINPEEYEIVEADSENIMYRFLHLFQLIISLSSDKNIDLSELELKYSDGKEYKFNDYILLYEKIAENKFSEILMAQDKWVKIIDWNYYIIDMHLNLLKKKLCRYKTYVCCGNAPEDYKNYKKIL